MLCAWTEIRQKQEKEFVPWDWDSRCTPDTMTQCLAFVAMGEQVHGAGCIEPLNLVERPKVMHADFVVNVLCNDKCPQRLGFLSFPQVSLVI